MSDELILEQLRAIQATLDEFGEGLARIETLLDGIEAHLDNIEHAQAELL